MSGAVNGPEANPEISTGPEVSLDVDASIDADASIKLDIGEVGQGGAGSRPSGPARPRPVIGDASSAQERSADPRGWAFDAPTQEALARVIAARRDIRRYRPDPVPDELLRKVLAAGHSAPSVGHSQPWRFIVVREAATRDRAAHLADAARIKQARQLVPDRANRLLDLKLEGLREAPIGVVVACDRRTPAAGVLGRATFEDTDLWSCACAIENMWLTARGLGLGMGWVTLFEPSDLARLMHLPAGVETLGWMCLGWPDERPPEPGLQRAAWSSKLPLDDVILSERWPDVDGDGAATAPPSHLLTSQPARAAAGLGAGVGEIHVRGPERENLVTATDSADKLLTPPDALGVLDRALNRIVAIAGEEVRGGELILAGADHPLVVHGVSAYRPSVTRDVMDAAVAGTSLGAAHARAAGLTTRVVDAGVATAVAGAIPARPHGERGDLLSAPALTPADVDAAIAAGFEVANHPDAGLVALGEVGVGNTTVAAALAAALLGVKPEEAASQVVGLGSGADADTMKSKTDLVAQALTRAGSMSKDAAGARHALAQVGGPEIAVLTGVVLGAASANRPVILDGLATSVAALAAVRIEPASQAYLIAGQRSREIGHALVLAELGVEPLLELRLRAGEGVGACLASGMLLGGLEARRTTVRTREDLT